MLSKKLTLLALPLVATLSLQAASPFNDPFFNDPFGDDIFKEMMQMQKNMDKMFDRMNNRMQQRSSGIVSPLGTYRMAVQSQFMDKGDHYELITNIPESKENHIDITTEKGTMSVTAKIMEEKENKHAGMISKSSFVRMYQQAIPMPNDADETKITTAYENGKLVIRIEKKKGVPNTNTVKINGVQKKIETKKPAAVKTSELKKDKSATSNSVKITKEFDQTPPQPEKNEAEKSNPKESNSTIKKEIIHTDKNSMI